MYYVQVWCDGVCMAGYLTTSQTTSSQPLMLLLVVVVYDLPTGTVSLCLAVDSAHSLRLSGVRLRRPDSLELSAR